MRITGFGHLLFALGLVSFGIVNLVYADFGLNWQPVPAWVPARAVLADLSGGLLIAGGVGLVFARTARLAALVMTAYLLAWVVLLHAPLILLGPWHVGSYLGVAESMGLMCGGLVLYATVTAPGDRLAIAPLTGGSGRRIGRILFGLACLEYGLSHFAYAAFTASMIPPFLPQRLALAYLAGAGHFAAGLGLLFFVLPRLAATLEAIMLSIIVMLVHILGVIGAPTNRVQWTMLAFATTMCGATWVVAASLRDQPWGPPRRSSATTG
jgi:uncharacterized membrane protein